MPRGSISLPVSVHRAICPFAHSFGSSDIYQQRGCQSVCLFIKVSYDLKSRMSGDEIPRFLFVVINLLIRSGLGI